MVVVREAKNRIRDLVNADITVGKFGTGTTDPSTGDTDLETEVGATESTNTQTVGNQIINSKNILVSTIGNGSTLTEYAIFMNGGSTMLSRVTFPDFAKTSSLELHVTTNYRID